MTGLTSIARFAVLCVAALLTSCIDGREEYWLRADGGGHAELTYQLPEAVATAYGGTGAIRDKIAAFLEQSPGISASRCNVATGNGRVRIQIKFAFKSAMDLTELMTGESMKDLPSAASRLAGDASAAIHGRTIRFSRRISVAEALPGSAFMPASQLEGHSLTYVMHLPTAPEESNATRTEDDGSTLVWELPLSDAVRQPVTTRFTMEVPLPWRIVYAIAIPLTLISAGWLFLRKSKSRACFSGGISGGSCSSPRT